MTLLAALNSGKTGILASQGALSVVSHNIANVANEDYTRRESILESINGPVTRNGIQIGAGVEITDVVRQVDLVLDQRVRTVVGDQEGALVKQDILAQLEGVYQELTDLGLGSQLSDLFNSFSELANNPDDFGLRTVVVEQGEAISDFIRRIRRDLMGVLDNTDALLEGAITQANNLAQEITETSEKIQAAFLAGASTNSLEDQRDKQVNQLSELMDIRRVDLESGGIDIMVDSIPIVSDTIARKLEFESRPNGDRTEALFWTVESEGRTRLRPDGGRIGGLLQTRKEDVEFTLDKLNEFTNQLIFQVNRVHSQGQGSSNFESVVSSYRAEDPSMVLNTTDAGLDYAPRHGSFQFHVTQKSTGLSEVAQIDVDLDGLGNDDMTLQDLAAALDAVDNVSATVTNLNELRIDTDTSDFEFSFSEDSSNVLAALGINNFFQGDNAADMNVEQRLLDNPTLVAAGLEHLTGDNRNSLALAELDEVSFSELGGATLREFFARHVEDLAARISKNNQEVDSTTLLTESLKAQRQVVSGVSFDEEAVKMLLFQRAFQASARVITTVDQLTQLVISLGQ